MRIIQKKICLLGDFAVGKTSLVRQFIEGRFDDKYHSTIGVKISRKTFSRPYGELHLLVWDLVGSSSGLASVESSSYLHGATGALIVCDLTRAESLASLERYAHQMQKQDPNISLTLVANKVDLKTERLISDADLKLISKAVGGGEFFLTSAKTGEQVEAAFLHLADQIEGQP